MNILVVHLGSRSENLVATSILKGIKSTCPHCKIDWVTKDNSCHNLLKYSPNINNVYSLKELAECSKEYDLLVNLYPTINPFECPNITIKNTMGFQFKEDSDKYFDILYKEKQSPYNLFQIYYRLMGMEWHGEGYDIKYYPQSRTKKNKIGIAVANANLRNYITDKLKIDNKRLWHIPYKKNLLKRLDEINRCKEIITDDFLTFNLVVYLHKYVYFLQTVPYMFKLEYFGKGEIINVPQEIIRQP
ncbi:MAG TPA: hypothetical protein VMZ91_10140 [Candidatus Paceibacterota bacterium]|nr:hypothetical protein [Candidatus Paceibacterota bacterium]